MTRTARLMCGAAFALAATPAWAQADEETRPDDGNTFALGQIIVTAPRGEDVDLSSESVGSEAIYLFDRQSLDDTASLIPGVSASNSGGSRNERLLFVRGFDRFQVPLSIDGIRVYLPADGRLDYGRFLTPDLAEVQVAKGYASVLDGPGAMGGAVNLVTRKPTRMLEAELRGGLGFDNDFGYAGWNAFGLVGSNFGEGYAQASYTRRFVDHWDLPEGFTPTANQDGGARANSRKEDDRLNLKAGWTPGEDEYSISYTRQRGEKNAPLHITDPVRQQRNWTWPYWNIDSVYFLSRTQLGTGARLRTRAFYNTFDNLLRAFDDATQTTQTRGRAFDSYYEDEAYGGSAVLDVTAIPTGRLSIAAYYRRDRHSEFQTSFAGAPPGGFTEPRQVSAEDTWSVAAEHEWEFSPALSLTTGVSYDWRDLKRAEEYGTPPGGSADRIFAYPIANDGALNAQGRLRWTPGEGMQAYAGISSRTRFPTLFERFSSRFGGATSNPGLDNERATTYEIGGSVVRGIVTASAAVYYSHLTDVIVSVPTLFQGQPVSQSRNLGSGDYYGGEVSLAARVTPALTVGGNYAYVDRDVTDPGDPDFRPVGVPRHQGFAYALWEPIAGVQFVPSVEIASKRWTVDTAGADYHRIGDYALMGLRANVEVAPGARIGLVARNLLDSEYALADGFPEPGRIVSADFRLRL